ncbi:HAUS augmin-like complex subunit 3 [Physella acuta]|uniref:HAUS augmin-like complex subunit 3 n=1 Tax=Physella acuta TaxID=109671 RepID=UPI0027DAE0BB|nr:HAUS augmin-like complex subunit 3 [Physella acuta]
MSSHQFIETLKRIGYPGSNALDPLALEWAFENPSTLPFLEWFCNNISEDNVLTKEELEEYKEIEESGMVLSGPYLEEALKALGTDDSQKIKDIDEDIDHLKETLARTKLQKETLKSRCNKLNVHHMALVNKVTKMEEVEEQSIKACHQVIDQCGLENIKINESLQKLMQSVQTLITLYQLPKGENAESSPNSPFLSHLDLKAYNEAEEKYSRELTAFTKKQFFEGIADLAGEKDGSQYGLLDVSSPEKLAVDGEENASFLEDCEEFSRLQQIFPKSECDRINALVRAKKALNAVHEARSILHQLKSGQFPTSPSEISRLHHSTEQSIEAAKAEASALVASLPDLLHELGSLQGTEILTGDYDLKLKRQEYFTKNQEKIIEYLLSQRARNEFLTMLYDLETKCHRETHALLSSIRQMLEKHLTEWQQRMKDMDDPDLGVKKFERSVVDSRDTSSSRLYHLLGDSTDDSKMLYLPKQKIVERAKNLYSEYKNAQSIDQTDFEKYISKVSQLEKCVKDCESALYDGSSTSSGLPCLSPVDVQSAMATLMSKLSSLETDITGVIADVNTKKAALKNNVLLSKERELFILYHTNPSRLQYVVNGLCERTKVQDIS